MTVLVVLAKEPVPGRVKTRCTPPCTPRQAAAIAAAALADTLVAAAATDADRHVLVLDGQPGPWVPDRFEVIAQRGGGLDERLAAAFADVAARAPVLLIGMDTPQVDPPLLTAGVRALQHPDVDAVLGRASDGGYWAIGLKTHDPALFHGVPMSQPTTATEQQRRLHEHGLRVQALPILADVDTFADALAVARVAPDGEFASTVGEIHTAIMARPARPPTARHQR